MLLIPIEFLLYPLLLQIFFLLYFVLSLLFRHNFSHSFFIILLSVFFILFHFLQPFLSLYVQQWLAKLTICFVIFDLKVLVLWKHLLNCSHIWKDGVSILFLNKFLDFARLVPVRVLFEKTKIWDENSRRPAQARGTMDKKFLIFLANHLVNFFRGLSSTGLKIDLKITDRLK